MHTIKQLLQIKGNDVWSVALNTPVIEALQLMAEKNIGSVLVLDEGKVAGIFSERDYARRVVLHDLSATATPVGDIMTARVHFVQPKNTMEDCMALMTEKRIRHLPVLADGEIAGMISIGDVVKSIMNVQASTIEELMTYITGTPASFN